MKKSNDEIFDFDKFNKYLREKNDVEVFEETFDIELVEFFNEIINENLTKLERDIYIHFYIDGKSLKSFSQEHDYSYSHVQGTHMRLKSKIITLMRIFEKTLFKE